MRASEDISPWLVPEHTENKEQKQNQMLYLPKVISSSSRGNPEQNQMNEKTKSNILSSVKAPTTLKQLRQQLFIARSTSLYQVYQSIPPHHRQLIRQNSIQIKPNSNTLALKNPLQCFGPVQGSCFHLSKNKSTPALKNRMQAIIKTYEKGRSSEKYIKFQREQTRRSIFQKIQTKKQNIEFYYSSPLKLKLPSCQKPKKVEKNHILDSLLGRFE